MCDILKNEGVSICYLRQEFGEKAGIFLEQLIYWVKTNSGVVKDGVRWIYNTQNQWADKLGMSRRTICRITQELRAKNIIQAQEMCPNRRIHTLYYSVNIDVLKTYLRLQHNNSERAEYSGLGTMDGTQDGTIYTDINLQKINKSNKSTNVPLVKDSSGDSVSKVVAPQACTSADSVSKKPRKKVKAQQASPSADSVSSSKLASAHVSEGGENTSVEAENTSNATIVTRAKPTTVQDMVRIWNKNFPKSPFVLDKQIARYLVAAFKKKFSSSMEEWERYLKLIKTSAFIMGETFYLTIGWAIKFTRIDQLRAGWCGTKPSELPVAPEDTAKITANHIDSVQESEKCKEIRRQIAKKISCENYNNWFTHVELVEIHSEMSEKIHGKIYTETYTEIYMKPDSIFARDYIMQHFQSEIGLDFLPDNGGKTSSAKSLEKIIKDAKTHPNDLAEAKNAMDHIDAVQESPRCKEARKKIAEQISPDLYNKWFTHVKLLEINGEILMKAENDLARDYISQKFGHRIELEFVQSPVLAARTPMASLPVKKCACSVETEINAHAASTARSAQTDTQTEAALASKIAPTSSEIWSRAENACQTQTEAENESSVTLEAKEAVDHIEAVQKPQKHQGTRKKTAEQISQESYNKCFTHVKLPETGENVFMKTDNAFARDYISQEFSEKTGLEFTNVTVDPSTALLSSEAYASNISNAEAVFEGENTYPAKTVTRTDAALTPKIAPASPEIWTEAENACPARTGQAKAALASKIAPASPEIWTEAENACPARLAHVADTADCASIGEILGKIMGAANRNNAPSFTNNLMAS